LIFSPKSFEGHFPKRKMRFCTMTLHCRHTCAVIPLNGPVYTRIFSRISIGRSSMMIPFFLFFFLFFFFSFFIFFFFFCFSIFFFFFFFFFFIFFSFYLFFIFFFLISKMDGLYKTDSSFAQENFFFVIFFFPFSFFFLFSCFFFEKNRSAKTSKFCIKKIFLFF